MSDLALAIQIKADGSGLVGAVNTGKQELQQLGAAGAAAGTAASGGIDKAAAEAGKLANGLKLNRIALLELQASGVNAFQALAAGISPLTVAMTEGAQVIGALVQGGILTFGRVAAALSSPVGLAVAAVTALAGGILYLAGTTDTATVSEKQWQDAIKTSNELSTQAARLHRELTQAKADEASLTLRNTLAQDREREARLQNAIAAQKALQIAALPAGTQQLAPEGPVITKLRSDLSAVQVEIVKTQQALEKLLHPEKDSPLADAGDAAGNTSGKIAQMIAELREEAAVAKLSDLQRAQSLAVFRAENAAREEGRTLTGAQIQTIRTLVAEQVKETAARKANADMIERATQAAEQEQQARERASKQAQDIIARMASIGAGYQREVADNQTLIEALKQGNDAYQQQAALLEILNRYRANGTPLVGDEIDKARELAKTLGQQRDEIDRLKAANDSWRQASTDATRAIGTAFEDATVNGKGLRDVLQGLLQDMERIALRLAVTKPLEGALGGVFTRLFTGGGPAASGADTIGAVEGSTAAAPFPVLHGGGIIGASSRLSRRIANDNFIGAPRFHYGGLLPGEVPIIGKRGEGVFTPEQMDNADRLLGAALAGGGTTVQIIDQRGAGAPPATVQRDRQPDGRELIRVIIKEVARDIAQGGEAGRTIGSSFGLAYASRGR